jgi:hypothetical protein
MSVFEMIADETAEATTERAQASYATSPFVAAALFRPVATTEGLSDGAAGPPARSSISTPFAEALASYDEAQLEAETFEALLAEFEDEDFVPALQALADEAAARHLAAAGSWTESEQGLARSAAEAQQWMEAVADRGDRLLAELESHFGQRPVESLAPGEVESVAGRPAEESLGGPPDTMQMFEGKLLGKVTKVVRGVGKVLGKVALGPVFRVLRKLVRPLLRRVLQRAIGQLPAQQRPLAEKLRGRFGGTPTATAASGSATPGSPTAPADPAPAAEPAAQPAPDAAAPAEPSTQELADEFDTRLAEALLTQESAADELLAHYEAELPQPAETGPYAALDAGRQRLAQQLLAAEPGRPPTAELEEFIPVVMAAMKLIKLGVRVIGRPRVVGFIAKLLANLIKGMVGEQPARVLSRHIASTGLRLLGLEAEHRGDPMLGAEALVAATEDTIREVLSLPAESLDNELLLEAAVQEAFTAAAVRHFPGEVLRPELTESTEGSEAEDGERGIWIMHPRAARPHYRYKKFTVIQPVRITRALARTVILTDGETLEDRLLDAGARRWPVAGEVHRYEPLPGAELGHLAAYEIPGETPSYAEAARQFEAVSSRHPLAHPSGPQRTTVVRVVVPGLALRPFSPFSVRLDLTRPRPQLRLHLHFGERVAHELGEHVAQHRMAAVVAAVRRHVGPALRAALADRLVHKLGKHGIILAEGRSRVLADELAEAVVRTAAHRLPASADALRAAARNPKAGLTMTFEFGYANREAIKRGPAGAPSLSIHSGQHRD